MFLLTLDKYSDDLTFRDPYIGFTHIIFETFSTFEKAREAMNNDFMKRFDADSCCKILDDKIEIEMIDEKFVYQILKAS